MKHIRIGKEITVRWAVLTNGEPLPLAGRDLRLLLRTPRGGQIETPFMCEDNLLHFVFRASQQHHIGRYGLTLYENFGRDAQSVVDCCDAFSLVATTCEERGTDAGLTAATVELQAGALEVGIRGESAYEIYRRRHPESALTEEQYAALPIEAAAAATTAGEEATAATRQAAEATQAAEKQTEQAKVAATAASAAGAAAAEAAADVRSAIDQAEQQTARVAAYADHPPKIERPDGVAYWAFWDEPSQRYAISDFRADDGMIVERIESPEAVLDTAGGHIYECGELRSLTLRTVADSPLETVIRFRSGSASATNLTCPDTLLFDGDPAPVVGHSYELSIAGLRAVIVSFPMP